MLFVSKGGCLVFLPIFNLSPTIGLEGFDKEDKKGESTIFVNGFKEPLLAMLPNGFGKPMIFLGHEDIQTTLYKVESTKR